MRHRRAGVHLSRPTAHRKALFSNLVAALLTNERLVSCHAAPPREIMRNASASVGFDRSETIQLHERLLVSLVSLTSPREAPIAECGLPSEIL